MQEFVFIRKDLLNRYLAENGQRFAWTIYGGRALYNGGIGGARATRDDSPSYIRYQKVHPYDRLVPLAALWEALRDPDEDVIPKGFSAAKSP